MKKSIWLVIVFFTLGYGLAMAQLEDSLCEYSDGDTVYLDSVYDISANQDGIPFVIDFANEELIDGIRVPLIYYNAQNMDIYFDSVSWKGSRVEYVIRKEVVFDPTGSFDNKEFLIAVTPFPDEKPIPSGKGLLCALYFHTGPNWDREIEVEVDTTRVNGFFLSFVNERFDHCCFPNLPWKGLLSGESTTGVEDRMSFGMPENYFLAHNYPNPFNPVTTIEFSIHQGSRVKLEIYNILGQKVRTLMDKTLSQGTHRIKWDSKDEKGNILPSGIYFYRIESLKEGKYVTCVNKMTLVK